MSSWLFHIFLYRFVTCNKKWQECPRHRQNKTFPKFSMWFLPICFPLSRKRYILTSLFHSSSFNFRYSSSSFQTFVRLIQIWMSLATRSQGLFFFLTHALCRALLLAWLTRPWFIYNMPHGAWTSSDILLISKPIFLPAWHSLTQRILNLSHLSC